MRKTVQFIGLVLLASILACKHSNYKESEPGRYELSDLRFLIELNGHTGNGSVEALDRFEVVVSGGSPGGLDQFGHLSRVQGSIPECEYDEKKVHSLIKNGQVDFLLTLPRACDYHLITRVYSGEKIIYDTIVKYSSSRFLANEPPIESQSLVPTAEGEKLGYMGRVSITFAVSPTLH